MRNKRLATIWTSHLKTPEEKQKFEEHVRNSTDLLDRLLTITKEKIYSIEVSKKEDYDSPGWPYKRADRDGQIKILRDFSNLLDLS